RGVYQQKPIIFGNLKHVVTIKSKKYSVAYAARSFVVRVLQCIQAHGCYSLDVIFKILTYKKIPTFMIHLLPIKRFYLKKWPSYSVLKFMRFRWDTLYLTFTLLKTMYVYV